MASVIPSPPLGTDADAAPHGLGAAPAVGPQRGAPAERRFRFELAAHPRSPAQARRLTRARLNGWSVCEDTCDTAALVVSELVTNAIRHVSRSTQPVELAARITGGAIRVEVRDGGTGFEPGKPKPRGADGGFGLFLVERMASRWGVETGDGTRVWFELDLNSGSSRA